MVQRIPRKSPRQNALSIARSCQKHLSHLTSMGYAAGAALDQDAAGRFTVTTPYGDRFEVRVREITPDEEIAQAKVVVAAKNLPPVSAPEPRVATATGKAARIFAHREDPSDPAINGEYVYRNYACNFDGRTWSELTPAEQASFNDRAAALVRAGASYEKAEYDRVTAKAPNA